jgi:hypothetical protein
MSIRPSLKLNGPLENAAGCVIPIAVGNVGLEPVNGLGHAGQSHQSDGLSDGVAIGIEKGPLKGP